MTESEGQAAQVNVDARTLRGIAHPLRIRILGILRTDGPATASILAARLGQNTGATSYHLRQLAEYGFVSEVAGRGTQRERWWQATHANTALSDDGLVAGSDSAGSAYLHSLAQVWADSMMRAVDATPSLPEAWRTAQDFGDYAFTLTPAQARDLMAEIHGVLKRRSAQSADTTANASPAGPADDDRTRVTFQFQLFPDPEDQRSHQ